MPQQRRRALRYRGARCVARGCADLPPTPDSAVVLLVTEGTAASAA
ncbi:hypothetical protein [Actinoplanes subtropicus]|nr:hypothetical protein [Actinoplanes subtropicus]